MITRELESLIKSTRYAVRTAEDQALRLFGILQSINMKNKKSKEFLTI